MDLLKLHKYFFWADKKLHAVFFIENKDEISEDLLYDFKDEEDDVKVRFKKSEALGAKKMGMDENKPKAIKVDRNKDRITKEDLLFGGNGKKQVNIQDDDDFPDLEGMFGQAKVPNKRGPKIVAKKQPQANTSAWGYNEEAPTQIGGNKVILANNKARPQTAALKTEKTVDIRKQQDLEKKQA